MAQLVSQTRQLLADTDTPVSAFVKLCRGRPHSFLFESGEAVERIGRYSVVAWDPLCRLTLTPQAAELDMEGRVSRHPREAFFDLARRVAAEMTCPDLPALPFVGALVGHLGYEAVGLIERLPVGPPHPLPQADLCLPACYAVFDHHSRLLTLAALGRDQADCQARLAEAVGRLAAPVVITSRPAGLTIVEPPRQRFLEAVKRAKEYILDGDIFQVVLSDRFTGLSDVDPLSVYRWLRVKSPSPYMFFLDYGGCQLVGASPETLVRVEDGQVFIRPIAGTRGRSADPERDRELEREMLGSEKEVAEHVMLVDLARNDAGRVCAYGSVRVEPYMTVERYSHVMHIVSAVTGRLRPGLDAWDAFQAGFPAGTVSGAPKVRAMEIIHELEDGPRGPYAGAVGFFGPGPSMDTCIAIRMIEFRDGGFTVQAGAGIVADSVPEMEYQEIGHKAAQGLAALKAAAEGGL